ncbi:unnamed protein product [Auanema sp. JU1783]|nr:unnamed protein product [Auanema sp. JU1783]
MRFLIFFSLFYITHTRSVLTNELYRTKRNASPAADKLGSEITISLNQPAPALGDEVSIPFNEHKTVPTTTSRSVSVHTDTTRRTFASAAQKSIHCPSRVDAFSPGPTSDLLFDKQTVYEIKNNRIIGKRILRDHFPQGPSAVSAAVYDEENELIVLLHERQVYAFKKSGNAFELLSSYPKTLPQSVNFLPTSALKWHDKHQILLSDNGDFALYDEYWNKSLMSGTTLSYFEGLPDGVRGVSSWKNGRAFIYTVNSVHEYDQFSKGSTNEKSLSEFLEC